MIPCAGGGNKNIYGRCRYGFSDSCLQPPVWSTSTSKATSLTSMLIIALKASVCTNTLALMEFDGIDAETLTLVSPIPVRKFIASTIQATRE